MIRSTERESSDEEEAHSLVEEYEENDVEIARQKKREFLEDSSNTSKISKLCFVSALLDIAGYVIRTMGYCFLLFSIYRMVYCGSGLFQVAFSSVAVFSAIYSRLILGVYVSPTQWFGIAIVTTGLCISSLSSNSHSESLVLGIILTLIGAQFYALSYIVNEYISVFSYVNGYL